MEVPATARFPGVVKTLEAPAPIVTSNSPAASPSIIISPSVEVPSFEATETVNFPPSSPSVTTLASDFISENITGFSPSSSPKNCISPASSPATPAAPLSLVSFNIPALASAVVFLISTTGLEAVAEERDNPPDKVVAPTTSKAADIFVIGEVIRTVPLVELVIVSSFSSIKPAAPVISTLPSAITLPVKVEAPATAKSPAAATLPVKVEAPATSKAAEVTVPSM